MAYWCDDNAMRREQIQLDVQQEDAIRAMARKVTEDTLGGAPFAVGDIVMHPSGRKVEIVSGQYWSNGRVSNWWTWRECIGEGRGEPESGYGWKPS